MRNSLSRYRWHLKEETHRQANNNGRHLEQRQKLQDDSEPAALRLLDTALKLQGRRLALKKGAEHREANKGHERIQLL